ncbi:UDP-forming cellulose synthase catalytic subunit [Eleftheria terrae]|uniref:UDP-forming cellulose synthase catalytic subunit n=1 Tax=Eleftheria terrae TaxID=1597781 RepID=UPI00263A3E1C|nr:UDP-forming cellulose synthase catalytic subunit [Eleftheria terrae]WKB53339.1 UDP-forming cellulose synthase catalytic subunit [Eleftheria terrae]
MTAAAAGTTVPRPGRRERWQRAGWVLGLAAFLFLAMLPTSQQAQMVWSGSLLLLLGLCYRIGRRTRQLEARRLTRLATILLCTFLSLRYMHWRATESLPLQYGLVAMVCGLLLLAAEGYGLVNMLLGFFVNSEPFFRRSLPLPDDPGALPHVDVYIPTYNEDPAILRPTVIAATQMHYPRDKLHVWVLDDGGTVQKCQDADPAKAAAARSRAAELRALAERFGAGYITRERNLHAKAGNINSALPKTQGDLLLILDCDHIPTADFLQRCVGFFLADPKLFVLQTPHNFVSPDPVERNLSTFESSPAENELFYDVMQPGLDFWGTSFFCGSAAVLRRSVIDQLGGVSGQTITEDAETTLDALALGYKSAYYNRPMVSGLQPETYSGFIVQRVRWGQGMLQIFILKNPWRLPGLSLVQRVLYTNFAFYWGFAAARIIMLLAPPAYLLFGINLCDTTAGQLMAYAGPALIASLVSTQFFFGRVRWPFMSQLYEIIQSVYVVQGLVEVVRRPRSPSFKVTPKGEVLDREFVSTLATPFYLLLVLTSLGIVFGMVRYASEPWNHGAIAFVQFWAVLDVLLLLGALGITFEQRQLRSEPRAPHREPVRVHLGDGQALAGHTVNASASGLGLTLELEAGAAKPAIALHQVVEIELPGRGGRLLGEVLSLRQPSAGRLALGLKYQADSEAAERLGVDLAFGSSDQLVANNERRHAGRSVLRGLLGLARYAVRHGVGHLLFLARKRLPRRALPSSPSSAP